MPEYLDVLILFGVGLLAGVINVMAGGGSSLTLPALIFIGLDSSLANGTNRIGILLQSITATLTYRKAKISEIEKSVKLSLLTLPGAVLGALVSLKLSNEWFDRILGLVMIGIIVSMLIPQKFEVITNGEKKSWLIYPVMLGIGFYGGFIQVGVGFLIMAAFYHLLNMDLIRVNMHKVFVTMLFTVPALIIFIWTGNVDWVLGLCLAAGNALGGWWAVRFSIKGGERIIRYVMVLAIFIIALKLLGII
ncbi:MAG TPA: sulfite exporter TauE/SafE family protein [Thermodesulfobacteriota bacterium]|nr:sulfite exporter TauE/SafE family protein [Thermodesulfobacteriota bacterium]